jgi:hypothetical protein
MNVSNKSYNINLALAMLTISISAFVIVFNVMAVSLQQGTGASQPHIMIIALIGIGSAFAYNIPGWISVKKGDFTFKKKWFFEKAQCIKAHAARR